MTRQPTGRIQHIVGGRDLVLERTFRAPIEDVWASVTESERTTRWLASWTGEPAVGQTIMMQMTAEDGAGPEPAVIRTCEEPRHLALDCAVGDDTWRLEATLVEVGGTTTLTFVHHLQPVDDAANIGPGWEYYLDRLVADRNGDSMPGWDEYYPAQSDHYATLGG